MKKKFVLQLKLITNRKKSHSVTSLVYNFEVVIQSAFTWTFLNWISCSHGKIVDSWIFNNYQK